MMTVALLALVAGAAMADCGSCPSDATDAAVAADTGCGGAAGSISAQATQNGYTYTYALNNGSLEKRKGCGMVVESVKVACPMLGAQAGMRGCGGGDGCAMRGGGEGHGPKLTADADGVYLKCRGNVFAWDLDLNPKAAPAAGCSMGSAVGGCGGASCSMANWEKGPSENRGLQGGIVSLKTRPMRLSAGVARIQLTVLDTALAPDGDATVSAFVYPTGQLEAGSVVEMVGTDAGEFQAAPDLAAGGVWELSIRVVRPGSADEIVYYMLNVQ